MLVTPVASSVMVIVAPGIAAPDGSVTLPSSVPMSRCAMAGIAMTRQARSSAGITLNANLRT